MDIKSKYKLYWLETGNLGLKNSSGLPKLTYQEWMATLDLEASKRESQSGQLTMPGHYEGPGEAGQKRWFFCYVCSPKGPFYLLQ